MQATDGMKKATDGMKIRIAALSESVEMRVSDDTMRWLFGTPSPALTAAQQFQRDFVADKPDVAASRARRAFCTRHGLKAKQDKATGYWAFVKNEGVKAG